jgi:hypothetical protein
VYWILSNELVDEDRDADLSGSFSTELGDDISFDDGEKIPFSITKAIYKLTDPLQGDLTDHLSIDEIPGLVFSDRLCQLFHNMMITNLQYFPLTIINASKDEVCEGYNIVNILGVVDCVDRVASDLEYFDSGDIEFVNKLVLDETKIPSELDIFRLAGRTTMVIVSQVVKDAIIGAGMTGCVFYKPEDYH